jgi:NitT/TauT family transport system substrate-binding protein
MAPANSPIHSVEDLKGRRIGVAGGPLDKSWLMLRALARRAGFDPARDSEPVYGAPKLLQAKAEQGELDAVLNYWNICADMETSGFRRAIEMEDVEKALGANAPVALVGYAFDGVFAAARPGAVSAFLRVSSRARRILVDEPAEWRRIAARVGASSDAALDLYRSRFAQGAATRPLAEEIADARALYRAIAREGGAALVGPAAELDPAAYWRPPLEATR